MFYNNPEYKVFYLPTDSKRAVTKWNDDSFWEGYKGCEKSDKFNHALHLARSNLVCIDVDPRNFTDRSRKFLMDMRDILPTTYSHATASNGRHFIFSVFGVKDLRFKKEIVEGIDIKYNGYIVIPPSTFEGKSYTEDSGSNKDIVPLPLSLYSLMKVDDKGSFNEEKEEDKFQEAHVDKKFDYLKMAEEVSNKIKEQGIFGYDTWVSYGMCLHTIFKGSEAGLTVFKKISSNDLYPNGEIEAERKWDTFKSEGRNKYRIRKLSSLLDDMNLSIDRYISKDYIFSELDKKINMKVGEIVTTKKDVYMSNEDCMKVLKIFDNAPYTKEIKLQAEELAYQFFKDRVFYVKNKKGYATITNKGTNREDMIIYNSDQELKEAFRPYSFTPAKGTEKNLVDYYKSSPKRVEYTDIVYTPDYNLDSSCISVFPRGCISKEPTGEDYDMGIIKPFLDLILHNICGVPYSRKYNLTEVERNKYKFILWWVAHMLRRPSIAQSVFFVLWGRQGTGKNLFTSTIAKCLVEKSYFRSMRKSDLQSNFNDYLDKSFFVVCDEMPEKINAEAWGVLKAITGSDRIAINPKFGKMYEATVRARFVFTSNFEPLFGRSSDNRRVVIYETKKHFTDFGVVASLRENPEFISNLCRFFNTLDLDEFSPSIIPKEKIYTEEDRKEESSLRAEVGAETRAVFEALSDVILDSNLEESGLCIERRTMKGYQYLIPTTTLYDLIKKRFAEKYKRDSEILTSFRYTFARIKRAYGIKIAGQCRGVVGGKTVYAYDVVTLKKELKRVTQKVEDEKELKESIEDAINEYQKKEAQKTLENL